MNHILPESSGLHQGNVGGGGPVHLQCLDQCSRSVAQRITLGGTAHDIRFWVCKMISNLPLRVANDRSWAYFMIYPPEIKHGNGKWTLHR